MPCAYVSSQQSLEIKLTDICDVVNSQPDLHAFALEQQQAIATDQTQRSYVCKHMHACTHAATKTDGRTDIVRESCSGRYIGVGRWLGHTLPACRAFSAAAT